MATVRHAAERLRESGALAQSTVISVKALHQQFQLNPLRSTRALLSTMFNKASKKMPWAVILCRFNGEAPNANLEGPIERIYRGMFAGARVGWWNIGGTFRWERSRSPEARYSAGSS
jgi:hypothetical protein